jgi:phage-related baseplate assembly protein|nr:MAG TPA: baseplate assembly protein [Caudoviricetes sp.]
MSETLPRWGLKDISFLTTDPAQIEAEIITTFEKASGRTLAAGDPVRLFLLSLAAVIVTQRSAIDAAAKQNLLSYSQGEYLDALGLLLSVERLAESKAVTTLRFTLSRSLGSVVTIPKGTEVTNGTVTFATVQNLDIPIGSLTGDVIAECTESGEAGNDYLAGQIKTIVKPMTFVSSAENVTITAGGASAENDLDYANRIRLAPNSFSVAGPEKAYIYHAKSVSSAVIDVCVDSPTPGEVDVYVLLKGGELPKKETLDQIETRLRDGEIRPLTDYVRVLAPSAVKYSIRLDYWISKEDQFKAAEIKASVEKAVESYRTWQQSKIGRDITPEKLTQLVVSAGACRIDSTTMQPTGFKALTRSQVAQCTGVQINYKGLKDE